MKPTPSFVRIIQVDYLAQLGVLLPLVIWAMALALWFLDRDAAGFFRLIAPLVTVLGLTLLFWRARLIVATYEDGSRTSGTVTQSSFLRGRGCIYYAYMVAGRKHLGSNAINQTRRTRAVQPGQHVSVTYHPHEPQRAFVDELYL